MNLRHRIRDPSDPDHVYIGRENRWYSLAGSKWRNPFVLHDPEDSAARAAVVARYRRYLLEERPDLLEDLPELRGRTLYCFCAPPGGLTAADSPTSATARCWPSWPTPSPSHPAEPGPSTRSSSGPAVRRFWPLKGAGPSWRPHAEAWQRVEQGWGRGGRPARWGACEEGAVVPPRGSPEGARGSVGAPRRQPHRD